MHAFIHTHPPYTHNTRTHTTHTHTHTLVHTQPLFHLFTSFSENEKDDKDYATAFSLALPRATGFYVHTLVVFIDVK